jgi:hypothetical protein
MSEWRQLWPHHGPDFEALCHAIGLDARTPPPTTPTEAQQWRESMVLESRDSTRKGKFMKQSAWYSIARLIDKCDSTWHCYRFMSTVVADNLMRGSHGMTLATECARASVSASDAHAEGDGPSKGASTSLKLVGGRARGAGGCCQRHLRPSWQAIGQLSRQHALSGAVVGSGAPRGSPGRSRQRVKGGRVLARLAFE